MASKNSDSELEHLECPVCLEIFIDPRDLPCPKVAHTLCKDCMASLVKDSSIKCPLCRKIHIVPQNGVEGFERNKKIVRHIKTLCKECRRANPIGKCGHCREMLCQKCTASHEQFAGMGQVFEDLRLAAREADLDSRSMDIFPQSEVVYGDIDDMVDNIIAGLEDKRRMLKEEARQRIEENATVCRRWKQKVRSKVIQTRGYLESAKQAVGDKYGEHITERDMAAASAMTQESMKKLKKTVKNIPPLFRPVLEYEKMDVHRVIASLGTINQVPIDTEACRVQGKVTDPLTLGRPKVFGQRGSIPGEFLGPSDVAVCPVTSHVVVADPGNARIQVFTDTMKHVLDITTDGNGKNLTWPSNVAVNSRGHIFVSDSIDGDANSVQVYDQDGAHIRELARPWNRPLGIAIDQDDNIYVCDRDMCTIRILNSGNKVIKNVVVSHGSDDFSGWPFYITVCRDFIMVADYGGRVHQFTKSGAFVKLLDQTVVGYTTGLALYGNDRLVLVEEKGPVTLMRGDRLVDRVGERGREPWQLNHPCGVCVTPAGRVIVANCGNDNVLIYDMRGQMEK